MSSIRYLYLDGKDLDEREREMRRLFFEQLEEEYLQKVKERIEWILKEDVKDVLGCDRYERTSNRQGYRGGYRYRDLQIWGGEIRRIKVPKGVKGLRFWLFEPYQRRIEKLSTAMYRAFIYGMSDRKVSDYFKGLYGESILSAQGVSRLYKQMTADIESWHKRPITDDYKYIYLDGMVQSMRGAYGNKRTILVAYGVKYDTTKEIIDYRIETGESAAAWSRFLQCLYDRGLKGIRLQLICHDGCLGLIDALRWLWPSVKTQLCSVHRLRNLAKRIKNRYIKRKLLRQAAALFKAPSISAAYQRIKVFERRWRYVEPHAIRVFLKNIDHSLVFYQLPSSEWAAVCSTNPVERQLEELRRRLIPMRCLNNPVSCDRIIFGLVMERYFKESALNQKSELLVA